MPNTIVNTVGMSLANVLNNIIDYTPQIVIALLLVVLGFVVGDILGRAAAHFLHMLKLDKVLDQAGMDSISKRSGVSVSVSRFVGQLVKWSMVIAFAMMATDTLGLRAFTAFLYKILNYLPNVFVAGLILVATFAAAEFVKSFVDGSVRAAGLHASMAGKLCKYSIIVFGLLSSLSQLNIASQFMETLFTGIVAAISLALGLSFGLGGKDAAAKVLSRLESDSR